MKQFINILFMGICITAFAQTNSSFQLEYFPIKYEKNIPTHFQEYLQFGEEKKTIPIGAFYMNQIIQNGVVYFNGNISTYLNNVLKKITDANPGVNKNSKILLCKDVFPAIFSNTNDDILISTGMVSKLVCEEQLVYLIAKELVHISQKNPYVSYAIKKNIEKEFFKNGITFREVANHFFRGLTHQLNATEKALELTHNTRMDVTKTDGVYDGLLNISEPIMDFSKLFHSDSITIDPLMFKINSSEKIKINKATSLGIHEFGINTLSDTLKEKINNIRKTKGTYFSSNDSLFQFFKKSALFELVSTSFQNHQYLESLQTSLMLLQFYPENQFLHEYILKNLYWLLHYKSINKISEVIDYSNQNANYLSLIKFFTALNPGNFCKFFYLMALDKKTKFSQNEEISLLFAQAKEQLKGTAFAKEDYLNFLREFPGSNHSEFVRNKLLSLISSN